MSAHQFLTIFTWGGVAMLIGMMAFIARFYERLSNERTYFQFFLVPASALLLGALRLASVDLMVGDVWGEIGLFVGGISLTALCWHVYRLMTSGR